MTDHRHAEVCCHSAPARAAAYVRMSTMQQGQSTAQQLDLIARFAKATQCVVVKVYRDEGRSGLGTRRRHALLQMLADIGAGNPGFDRVLVYDVSRWGRFQDVDESAYYEYWCRRHGIAVVYCAEQFDNDGTPLSHIMKTIKRTMAAEYSRALSVRTFEAHAFLLSRGFKPGGAAGYGLRRVCLRADGSLRRELAQGERKGHPTDRVVLAPGPDGEVATVRRIYQLYIEDKLGYRALARRLDTEGATALDGALWTEARVKAVLSNEKYCGVLLYNRTTGRLGEARQPNDRALWLRHEDAHEPIVPAAVFAAAVRQSRLRDGSARESVLEKLRALHARAGKLTSRLVDAEPGMPHVGRLKKLFGGLDEAYRLALGPASKNVRDLAVRAAASALRRAVEQHASEAGAAVAATQSPATIVLAGVVVRLSVLRCRRKGLAWGWLVPARATNANFCIAALIDRSGENVVGFALLLVSETKTKFRWLADPSKSLPGVNLAPNVKCFFTDARDDAAD